MKDDCRFQSRFFSGYDRIRADEQADPAPGRCEICDRRLPCRFHGDDCEVKCEVKGATE